LGGIIKNRNGIYKDGTVIHAGASQQHSHSQPIALSWTPKWIYDELLSYNEFEKRIKTDGLGLALGTCSECWELRDIFSSLMITNNNTHVSYRTPYSSLNPFHFQIKILPINHQSYFDQMTREEITSFTSILHQTMIALGREYPNCGYNYVLAQAPWNSSREPKSFHWRFSIYPAWPDKKTMRYDGAMPLLLGIPILKDSPESDALILKSHK